MLTGQLFNTSCGTRCPAMQMLLLVRDSDISQMSEIVSHSLVYEEVARIGVRKAA